MRVGVAPRARCLLWLALFVSKAVISLSVKVKTIRWNTFGVPFFFFFRWRPMFSSYFLCVFFGVGPSASMRVRICIWTHRYFFTCNNFT